MLGGQALASPGPAPTEKEAKANVVRAVDEVARRLDSIRAVYRAYYIHQALSEAYLQGVVPELSPAPSSPKRVQPARPCGGKQPLSSSRSSGGAWGETGTAGRRKKGDAAHTVS